CPLRRATGLAVAPLRRCAVAPLPRSAFALSSFMRHYCRTPSARVKTGKDRLRLDVTTEKLRETRCLRRIVTGGRRAGPCESDSGRRGPGSPLLGPAREFTGGKLLRGGFRRGRPLRRHRAVQ